MRRLIAYMALAAVCCACSLDEKVTSYATSSSYYTSVTKIRTGLNGCYNPIRAMLNGSGFWEMCECATDLMELNISTQYNAICDISPTRPGIATTIWKNAYIGVMRTNELIADTEYSVGKGYITEAESHPLIAEAIVLRSFFYYLLTSTFGDVPFYTCKVTEKNRADIASLPRMDADSTRADLIEDLREWVIERKALPWCRSYDEAADFRAGSALGLMVGAKLCMWNKDWDGAIEFISNLESIYGGTYAENPHQFGMDYPLTDIPFSKKFAKESILEIANHVEAFGIQSSGTLAPFCMPSRSANEATEDDDSGAEDGSCLYQNIVIPELGGYSRTYAAARPTAYYYQRVLTYTADDLRSGEYSADSNVARGSSGNLAWRWKGYDPDDVQMTEEKVKFFKNLNARSKPWLGNKFWCFNMYNTKDSNNYKFLRFADALLMKAEAYLMSGNADMACRYLNITRTRAGYSEYISLNSVGGSVDALMEEIRIERAKELFGEYQRKFDLVRWGIWYERTSLYNQNAHLQSYIRPFHRYWPIPVEQVTYSGGALDNNEYNE